MITDTDIQTLIKKQGQEKALNMVNKERIKALYWLVKLYDSCVIRSGDFNQPALDRFLEDRKLHPGYDSHKENIKELFEEIEKEEK